MIQKDTNLNKFMTKIYRTTGVSILGSLGLSALLSASVPFVMAHPFATMLGGFVMSVAGIQGVSSIKPKIVQEKQPGGKIIENLQNPLIRKLAFLSFIGGSAISLSPLMGILMAWNPAIIPMAAGISALTMGGASLYAMYKPLGHFKPWESTLYSTLLGLVGMNVASLLLTACIGPNVISMACSRVDLYVGLGLFTLFQAYDTHKAVEAFEAGNHDYLEHVVDFFLNFKNLFVRIIQLIGNISGGSDAFYASDTSEASEASDGDDGGDD